MKILWLHRYTPHRHYNHWFHTDFAKSISEENDINLKMYGYRLHERPDFADLLLKPYNSSLSMKDLRKEFDYDVAILDCWNRAYKSVKVSDMWLPKDFKDINCPKIVIEGDYHNIRDPKWFSNLNIDLILHRHFTNVGRAKKDLDIKSIWLPCSIDNNIFKPNKHVERKNLICAVGEMDNPVYKYRITAMRKLYSNKMLFREQLVREQEYVKCLQFYISHLNGSSTFDLNIAKMFEIMASGSILFTDEVDGIGTNELFPDNAYCTYKRDYSDLLVKAKKIINEPAYRDDIIANGVKCIAEKHTHKIRAKQLINILKQEFVL